MGDFDPFMEWQNFNDDLKTADKAISVSPLVCWNCFDP